MAGNGTLRQREGIYGQHDADDAALHELRISCLESREIAHKHGTDEPDGTPYAYWRESPHGVEVTLFEGAVRHRICQRYGRHVECHAQGIERKERGEGHGVTRRHGIIPCTEHEQGSQAVTYTEQPLCLDPTVGYDTDQCRHEQRHDTLHGIKEAYVRGHARACQIGSHRRQIGAPHGKLQEIHNYQPKFYAHRYTLFVIRYISRTRLGRRPPIALSCKGSNFFISTIKGCIKTSSGFAFRRKSAIFTVT